MLDVQNSEKKYYAAEIPERERRMRQIACSCRLDSLNVTRHTRICSIYLNPVPSIFAFRQHHRLKPPKSRTDPEERRRKQWKETPQTSRSRKVFTSRKKKQDVNTLEGRIFCSWRSQYSLLSARVPWWRGSNWFNSLRNRSKLNGKLVSFYRQIQKFFCDAYSRHWL